MTTLLALLGAFLVSEGKWQGFLIWCFTNVIFAANSFYIDQYQMGILFSAYFFLAVNGIYKTRKLEV